MKLILFGHPVFFNSYSMDRFCAMIAKGMRERGHVVQVWRPASVFTRLPARGGLRKWLGYIDQYLLFPAVAWWRLRRVGRDTVVVLTDHALSMWMPLLSQRVHVVHCHDFVAQRMLAGEFPQLQLSRMGRLYQALIRFGILSGKSFVAVSAKTAEDMTRLFPHTANRVAVVHNGLNYDFRPMSVEAALQCLEAAGVTGLAEGMLMHIGGNQWYKNREGVLALYESYCRRVAQPRPLAMLGPEPTPAMQEFTARAMRRGGRVMFVQGLSNECVNAAYALAGALIFPSQEEGFGWPVIEAMACGTPVVTTAREPMRELGGGLAWLVEPMGTTPLQAWADQNVHVLLDVLLLQRQERASYAERALQWSQQFTADKALARYEEIYLAELARDARP